MKLYELPQRTKKGVKIYLDEGNSAIVEGKEYTDAVILFRHLDGMYSFCNLLDKEGDLVLTGDGHAAVVHLRAGTEIEPYLDGYRLADNEG